MSEEEDAVIIRFVLPPGKNETTCSEDLAYAFDQAQDVGLNPIWINHDDALQLNFTKMDVFVMDPFDGKAFQVVSRSKSTIVGPRCLLTCLHKKEPVPELPYPMFTAAMKGLIVTSTGFEKDKKLEIQRQVELMAGIYSNAFHDGVTHLIAAVVRSSKYTVAVEKEIPIMTAEWVQQVWTRSQNDNVDAVDRQFARYACPALMGLNISVSQMSGRDKDLLKKSIESHGGIYSKSLDMNSTNVLIIPTPEGEKYTYAKKWKIPTLNSNWVFDSIEKGYCLGTDDYKVEKSNGSSTPTKENVSSLAEVSMCSTIMGPPGGDETTTIKVNETVDNPASTTVIGKGAIRTTDSWFQSLDLNRVSKSGPFLEGCRIFLSGFDEVQQDHMRRVLQSAGASRMTQLTPSVTHMIVKSFAKSRRLKELNLNPHQVSVQWVVESMRLGRIATESDFAPPKMTTLPPIFPDGNSEEKTVLNEEQITQYDNDILALYSKKEDDVTNPQSTFKEGQNPSVEDDDDDEAAYSQLTKFLSGKKLALVGLDSETEQELSDWIDEEGGELVSSDFKGVLDFLVLPVHGCNSHNFKAKKLVNHLWLSGCFEKGNFVDVEYYDIPLFIETSIKPLNGVVISISGFTDREKQYICLIAEALGVVAQLTFAKKEKADTKKSTHLVCLSATGNKYDAAIRWKLPVVSKEWIFSCASKMTWLSEKPFLMGDCTVFTPDKPLPEDVENVPREVADKKETEVIFNTRVITDSLLTPEANHTEKMKTLAFETPGLDIEKIRPKKIELSPSIAEAWIRPPDSQPSPGITTKRKRHLSEDDTKEIPSFIAKMNTPDKSYGAFLGKDDPSPLTRKFWKYQYDKAIADRPSESERDKIIEQGETLDSLRQKREEERKATSEKWSTARKNFFDPQRIRTEHEAALDALEAKGIPVLERAGRSFDDLMEEKFNKIGKSWKNPGKRIKLIRDDSSEKKRPFSDVNLFITKKCASEAGKISEVVAQLGGSVSSSYTQEVVTHVVFASSKVNDITKEFRLARNDGKIIVAPEWVYACGTKENLIDPADYPHTFNSKTSASVCSVSPPINTPIRKVVHNTHINDFVDDDINNEIVKMDEIINSRSEASANKAIGSSKKIKMTLSSTECTPERSSLGGEGNHVSTFPTADFDSQALGSQIQWIDPKESTERKKLAERLSVQDGSLNVLGTTSGFQSIEMPDNLTEILADREDKENNKLYRFMLSGFSEDEKTAFSGLIKSLNDENITFSNVTGCDPEANYIIASKLSRSEKMLGSVASGKTFVHFSYLNDCLAQKRIIFEIERYEWGNPENKFILNLDEHGFERQLAIASYKWHLKCTQSQKGAFDGIVAIIHTSAKRREAFQRLLELGGGRVVTPNPPYVESDNATHCLAEPSKLPKSKIDYKSLASQGVAVVEPIYINEYLISEPVAPVENHLINEFKPFWFQRYDN